MLCIRIVQGQVVKVKLTSVDLSVENVLPYNSILRNWNWSRTAVLYCVDQRLRGPYYRLCVLHQLTPYRT